MKEHNFKIMNSNWVSCPNLRIPRCLGGLSCFLLILAFSASAQAPRPGGPPGRGGMNQERSLVEQFDADKNGRLNAGERAQAVEFIKTNAEGQGGRGGRGGGRGGRGSNRPPASPGVQLTSADVEHFPNAPLYDALVLRTFFIELENPNWESELVAFNNTDVEVPAQVTVDGKVYSDVGIHFRGNSSFRVGGWIQAFD